MKKEDLQKKKLPDTPGVYYFLGKRKEILYIGKATSLRSRVRSYFDADIYEKRSALIAKMVYEAATIEWTVTDSVLEALLLEVSLIRTHVPKFNTKSKDDRSYNHLVITQEDFPRILVVRGKDLVHSEKKASYKYVFGPFPDGNLFREALRIIRKLFQFYDSRVSSSESTTKHAQGVIDFNRQIGLYPKTTRTSEYARTIKYVRLFFQGKKDKIIIDLQKKMAIHAKKEEFELAHILKKKIFALKHIQDVALIKNEDRAYKDVKALRIEAYDIAHLQGTHMVGVMVVFSGNVSVPSEYRKFLIQGFTSSNDTGALNEIITRRFKHTEWTFPDLIVTDGGVAQKNAVEKFLEENSLVIPVVGVVKDDHHKPKGILGAKQVIELHKKEILHSNAEAHRFAITFHRKRRTLATKS